MMTKIKSYTDLEQSKKLAKILPIESADMYYMEASYNIYTVGVLQRMERDMLLKQAEYYGMSPCWSLSALLSVLPDYTLQTNTDGTVFVVCDSKKPMISDAYENPVDVCVAIIEKLHELKML